MLTGFSFSFIDVDVAVAFVDVAFIDVLGFFTASARFPRPACQVVYSGSDSAGTSLQRMLVVVAGVKPATKSGACIELVWFNPADRTGQFIH